MPMPPATPSPAHLPAPRHHRHRRHRLLGWALLACAAPAAATDLVLGQVLPLSGPLAGLGRSIQQGTQVCVDWLNQQGGVAGHRLRLDSRDDGGDPQRALKLARSLVADGEASLLLGPWGSAAAQAVLPWASQAGVPVLGPHTGELAARRPAFTSAFYLTANHSLEAQQLAEHLRMLGAQQVALIHQDSGPGAGALIALQEALTVAGLQIAAMVPVGGAQTAEGAVRAAAQVQPQAVVLATTGADSVAVLRALAAQRQHTGFLMGVHGLSFTLSPAELQALGPQARGLALSRVLPPAGDERHRVSASYQAALRQAGRSDASQSGLEGCLAPLVLAQALRGRSLANLQPATLLKALRDSGTVRLGDLSIPMDATRSPTMVGISAVAADGRLRD